MMVNYRNLEEFSLAVAELQQEEEVGIENEAIATKSDVAAYIRCRLDFSRARWKISDDVWKQFVFIMNLTTTPSTRKFVRRLNPERSRINLDVALKRIVYDPACADFVREHKYSVLKWLEELWQKGGLPKCWKECKLMPIRKETADEDDSDAYAPVLIPNYMYRLWDGVLVFKLDNEIKKHRILSKGQSHYGSGVTVKELIFMLEYFIRRKISEENGELYVLFAKIKSFKETMNRDKLFKKLHKSPIDRCVLSRIEEVYEETIVTHAGQKYWSNTGLNRSLGLTSLLASLYLSDLNGFLSDNPSGPFKIGNLSLSFIGHGGSVAVLAENAEHLDHLTERFDEYLTREELMLDYEKSRVVRFDKNRKSTSEEEEKRWKIGGLIVERADKYEWNKHVFDSSGSSDAAIEHTRRIAEKHLETILEIDPSKIRSLYDDPMELFDYIVLKKMRGVDVWGREVGDRLDDLQVRYARWVEDLEESVPDEEVLRTVKRQPLKLWCEKHFDKYRRELSKRPYGSFLYDISTQLKNKPW